MFIISGLERGGAENQLVGLANGLAGRGWPATVVSYLPFSATSLRSELHEPGVRAVTLNASNGPLKYASLVKVALAFRRARPDLLVGFMFHGMMTSRLLSSVWPVWTVSSVRNEQHGTTRERLLGLTDRLADAVTVQSQGVADAICGRGVAKPRHVHIIPNFVDIARFDAAAGCREATRRDLGIGEGRFLWLAAGRLHAAKDYPNLLRAFGKVARRRAEAQLVIAGAGPLEDEIRAMIRRLELSERVALLGLRRDMPELFAASDALVLSSAWEGMPVVALEAMASRRPVVATAVGAVPELISDGETGLVVPPGKHEALAGAMERVMKLSRRDRNDFGDAGYRRVRSEFSPERVLDQWEALFRRLLSGTGRNGV